MPVVSISLNDKLLKKLEEIEKDLGYSGRSEVIRTAVRNFINQNTELEEIKGDTTAVLTVKHESEAGLDIHDFQGLIRSQLHDHDQEGNCMQIFIVSGEAKKILEMKNNLESKRKVMKADISLG